MNYRLNKQFSGPGRLDFFDLHTNRKFLGTNPTLDYEFAKTQGSPETFAETPEGKLLIAIMEGAFWDLKNKKLRKAALAWIKNPRNWGVTSFVSIAENVLGCDPKRLREAMVNGNV